MWQKTCRVCILHLHENREHGLSCHLLSRNYSYSPSFPSRRLVIVLLLLELDLQGVFSCPGQLNRWPCHSLSHWLTFTFDIQRAILETCDHWDIWSEWWGDMTWQFSDFLKMFRFSKKIRFWKFLDFVGLSQSGHVSSSLWSNVSMVASL